MGLFQESVDIQQKKRYYIFRPIVLLTGMMKRSVCYV